MLAGQGVGRDAAGAQADYGHMPFYLGFVKCARKLAQRSATGVISKRLAARHWVHFLKAVNNIAVDQGVKAILSDANAIDAVKIPHGENNVSRLDVCV